MAQVLLLAESDVKAAVSMAEAIDAVEGAFLEVAGGRAAMPPKLYLDFPRYQGDLRIMPAALGSRLAGVKVVNSHPRNPDRGLPSVAAAFLLFSQETGRLLAAMGATYLTGLRTAAASAVATKHLARSDVSSLGLVGAGVQAGFHLEAMLEVREILRVLVWAPAPDRARRDSFLAEMRARFPEPAIEPAEEAAEAAQAGVVCTTTPSRAPVVPDGAVGPGTHINAVGADAPGKQELDPATLRRARIIVDDWEQGRHGGEVNLALASGELAASQIAGSLAEVVSGARPGRISEAEITIFDSTGLAIEDLAVASLVYGRATREGLGTSVDI
ncbi:MAG: ornithine cyclodeaminase family protein [Candidatus Methylomirabilales bacterium]